MPFLTIVTRTYKRPTFLAQCVASVDAQSGGGIQHVILEDREGLGIYGSYKWMTDPAQFARYEGEYIYCLDDDNVLIDPGFAVALAHIANQYAPDVVMVKAQHPTRGILPHIWKRFPMRNSVDLCNFAVRADVWKANAGRFLDIEQAEDFAFINHLFKAHHSVYWHDQIVARLQRVSWGLPEEIENINTPGYWDSRWKTHRDGYAVDPVRDSLYQRILEQLAPGQRILDIGGGCSRFSHQARDAGHAPHVVDLSSWAIGYLGRHGIPGTALDVEAWDRTPLTSGPFDVVVCTELLEHLDEPRAAVEMARAHADRAFFSVPFDRLGPETAPDHMRRYGVLEVCELIGQVWPVVAWEIVGGDTIMIEARAA